MAMRILPTMICTPSHTVCLSVDDNVYSFGKHEEGAHGHTGVDVIIPQKIEGLVNIIAISCGHSHTVCLDRDGSVFSFGSNFYGQLGIKEHSRKTRIRKSKELAFSSLPLRVELPPITQISCGYQFTVCLSDDGFLFSFGLGSYGRLGHGNDKNLGYPKKISSVQNVDFFECGGTHTICKTLDNNIFCWGSNSNGQLGIGNNIAHVPYNCINWISNLSNENIVDIKCGVFFTLVLTSNKEVYSCGNNGLGQLGREGNSTRYLEKIECLSEIIRIECGSNHSFCIDTDNNLVVFGDNVYGQLGLGDTDNRYTPVKHPSLSNIIDISSRGHHTFVKTSENEIYAFGHNRYSQLGIKTDYIFQTTPIQILEDETHIWCSNTNKPKPKSARSVIPH